MIIKYAEFTTRQIILQLISYILLFLSIATISHYLLTPYLKNWFSEPIVNLLAWLFDILILVLALLPKFIKEIEYRKSLKNNVANYHKLIETCPEPISLVQEGKFIYVNLAAKELLGIHSIEEIEDMNYLDLIPEGDKYVSLNREQQLLKGKRMELAERIIIRPDGKQRIIETTGVLIYLDDKPTFQICARDITQQKEDEKKIKQLAYYDDLTELANRRLFLNRLYEECTKAKSSKSTFSVLMIDQDDFKKVNDQYGHIVGDQLLQEVSNRIQQCVTEDDVVARLGGDEFSVILSNVSKIQTHQIITRIMDMMKEPITIAGQTIQANISIGCCMFPNDGKTIKELLNNADIAMYEAKNNGKNQYCVYTEDLGNNHAEGLALETKLRDAVEQEMFTLHYQPRLSTETGKIVGVEALIRLAGVSPAVFIPIAADIGLMPAIGDWVLRTACEQAKKWHDKGQLLKLSVNLSVQQLTNYNFVEKVKGILNELKYPPELLEFEITERFIKDKEEVFQSIIALDQMGIYISIDDFGTEYSTLGHIKQFPVDYIKIDKTFVQDITVDSVNDSIIKTIFSLSRNLNVKVVGEGVETKEQLNILQEFGCDEIQGFLFSKPLPSNEVEELFEVDFYDQSSQ